MLKEYSQHRLSNSILLTEESGAVRKRVKEIIKAAFPPQAEQQLAMSLNDPFMVNNIKPQVCQGGAEPQIWNSVANHPQQNTFLDFLRANLYSQLGINHNRGPIEYIVGAARIMCQDLGFYSFSESTLRGGDIIKFCKLLNAIHDYKKFFFEDGRDMDVNMDGMSYDEFIARFKDKYESWRSAMIHDMDTEVPDVVKNYKVVPIKDKFIGTGCMPIGKSLEFLLSLGQYTDWCICHENTLKSMYPQYTGGGGKVYVLLKDGYEQVERVEGEGCPLDEYGLSMICVIVGPDGMPDNVTTRWNHNNGGENPEGLRTALDVQRATGIKYSKVFKPRSDQDLDKMHMLGEEKTPSAMDQVGNKVNAGVMDAVTGGGMMEGAEPETDEYTIGGEGGNNEYFHVNEGKKSLMITEEQWKQLQLIIENEGANSKKAMSLLKKKGYSEKQCQKILNYLSQKILEEAKIGNFDFKKYFKPIVEFMNEDGLNVKPYPKVKLDWSEQDGLFIKTGYYEPESKTITIFCNDRHPKDILRTFCHEMIHHSQNLDGVDLNFSSEDDVKDNERLEEIESEAYLKGNVYFRKWTEYANKNSKDVLQEGKLMEDTDPKDIDLSSFNIKTALNPKFWKDEHLDSRIRMRLLDIADDFVEFLGVDWVKPEDVIMTGSLANYNWNKKFSDIDLHVLMDFSKVDERTDFVKEYFDSKKNLWNESHKDLSICGFPVEVYVQDSKEKHSSTGVYSLDKDKWITEPNRKSLKSSKINTGLIKKKVSEFMDKIDKIDDIYKSADNDSYKARKASEEAEKLWDEIRAQRKQGLSNAKNEITNGNIIYKTLRRLGYLDKIFSLRDKSYDKVNSLDESYD